MSWCLLEVMAEAIDGDNLKQTALELFDRLRLRTPLAEAFQATGLEGEEGWRAAARLKILLMVEAGAGKQPVAQQTAAAKSDSNKLSRAAEALAAEATSSTPTAKPSDASRIPASFWQDPDVRWLTGYNEAEGHSYVNREQYEELLWWLAVA